MDIETLKFPVGKFKKIEEFSEELRAQMIADIKSFPQRLTGVVMELSDQQLDTPYRPEGWTVRQVVHHLADSHINSYIRFRWTLTEDTPTIKAYDEKSWAELPDAKTAAIVYSINLLKAVHARWALLLERMTTDEFEKTMDHPDWKRSLSLNDMVQLYHWHGRHHLAHITSLIEREGW